MASLPSPRRVLVLALSCSFIETVPTHPDRSPGSPCTHRPSLMSDLRALLLTDVVDSTQAVARIGDAEMARLWAAHDRVARDLLPLARARDRQDRRHAAAVRQRRPTRSATRWRTSRRWTGSFRRSRRAPACTSARSRCARTARRRRARRQAARGRGRRQGDRGARDVGRHGRTDPAVGRCPASAGRDGLRLQSHGHWRLKGLDEPIELFEVGDDDAPFVPPPDGDKAYRVVRQGDYGCRCARSGTACRPSATPSSAASRRWPSWRAASSPARAWCRCSASAAPARRAW